MDDSPDKRSKIMARFLAGPENLASVLSGLTETQLDTAPHEDSWTIRQIVHHLADGDGVWMGFIKQAIGHPGGEFSLAWYRSMSQDEWATCWKYAERDIKPSLELFRSIRRHIAQLLEANPDAWNNELTFCGPQQKPQSLTIGEVVEMQAYHVVHHISAIQEILRAHGK